MDEMDRINTAASQLLRRGGMPTWGDFCAVGVVARHLRASVVDKKKFTLEYGNGPRLCAKIRPLKMMDRPYFAGIKAAKLKLKVARGLANRSFDFDGLVQLCNSYTEEVQEYRNYSGEPYLLPRTICGAGSRHFEKISADGLQSVGQALGNCLGHEGSALESARNRIIFGSSVYYALLSSGRPVLLVHVDLTSRTFVEIKEKNNHSRGVFCVSVAKFMNTLAIEDNSCSIDYGVIVDFGRVVAPRAEKKVSLADGTRLAILNDYTTLAVKEGLRIMIKKPCEQRPYTEIVSNHDDMETIIWLMESMKGFCFQSDTTAPTPQT